MILRSTEVNAEQAEEIKNAWFSWNKPSGSKIKTLRIDGLGNYSNEQYVEAAKQGFSLLLRASGNVYTNGVGYWNVSEIYEAAECDYITSLECWGEGYCGDNERLFNTTTNVDDCRLISEAWRNWSNLNPKIFINNETRSDEQIIEAAKLCAPVYAYTDANNKDGGGEIVPAKIKVLKSYYGSACSDEEPEILQIIIDGPCGDDNIIASCELTLEQWEDLCHAYGKHTPD